MVAKINYILNKYVWLILLILCLPAIYPLFGSGLMSVHDEMHVAWLYEMDQVIRIWQIPPRFVPDLSFNFGYPLFDFVFPLPFYLGEIFHLIGFNFVDSIKAVFILSLPLSALFMYLFLRTVSSKYISLFGAILYCYTPYRAVDIYVRGAIGEALSFVFLPLIGLSVIKLSEDNIKNINYHYASIGGLSVASLLLCHNITAYMFIPFIAVLAIIRIIFLCQYKLIALLNLSLSLLVGLLISAYFWVPALVDSSLVKYDTVYNFIDHSVTLKQLITPFWGYGASVPGPYDGMSFFLGVVNIVLTVFGVVLLFLFWKQYSKSQKILVIWAYLLLIAAIYMTNFRSTIVWENIPFISYFQFPWRFLIITTFAIPVVSIVLEKLKYYEILLFFLIISAIVLNWNYFKPESDKRNFDDYYLNRYIPNPIANSAYYAIGEEYLRLPVETEKRPDKNYPLVEIVNAQVIKEERINALKTKFEISATESAVLNYNKYNFPGWVSTINGTETEINSGKPFGQIQIVLPEGKNIVEIYFKETLLKMLLDIISLIALISCLILLSRKIKVK